jgi:hypothetical protein
VALEMSRRFKAKLLKYFQQPSRDVPPAPNHEETAGKPTLRDII